MARFITTIELHGAEEKDYKTLHSELEKESFIATRRTGWKGEYNREGNNITLQSVTDIVLKAAAKTGKKYSFTIIRSKPAYN